MDGYFVHQDDKAEFLENFLTSNYKAKMNVLTSVDSLLRDESLYNYVLTAFDLDPATESKSFIRQVLTSDLNNPGSVANRPSDKNYRELAEAFNFSADGKVAMPRVAQADGAKQDTIQLYNSRIGTGSRERSQCPRTTALRFSRPTSRVSRIRRSRAVSSASAASSRLLV